MKITYPRIGITGGRGFIGSHLFDYLEKRQIPTVLFDGDLLNDEDIKKFFTANKIQQVIHLVGRMEGSPTDQLKVNYLTTENLLRIGMDLGLKRIIYSSSAKVYGGPQGRASAETDMPHPDTYYGLYKLFSEQCIQYFAQKKNLEFVILRFSNVYGPGNKTGVIYDFESSIQKRKEITIIGDGKQRRNLLHIDDACESIECALRLSKSDIYNIASPLTYSILEIAQEFKKKYSFSIVHTRADETARDMILNIGKAQKELKFIPHIAEIRL